MLEDASLVDPERQLVLPSTTRRSTSNSIVGRPNAGALDVRLNVTASIAKINSSDNLMAKIPLELVTAIFALCLHEENSKSKDQGLKKGLCTLRLVCTGWRDVVEATPSLWKRVSIPLTVESLEQSADMAEQWINRAGKRPLEMHIYALRKEVWDHRHLEQFRKFAGIINASSRHLTVLRLDLLVVLLEMISGRPTNLNELVLMNSTENGAHFFDRYFREVRYFDRVPPSPGHSIALANLDGVASMPAPTTLCLDSIYLSSVSASWFNLTEADLQDISVNDLFTLLREAPLMTKLCLTESRERLFPLPDWSSPVFHTSLRVLSIRVADAHYLDTLFTGIGLTHLDKLKLSVVYSDMDPSSFSGFMERSSWPLKKLNFDGLHGINNNDLIHVLRSVPRLTELRIAPNRTDSNAGYTVKPLFRHLSRTSSRPPPQLENFDFSGDIFLPVLESLEYVSRSPTDWHKFGKLVPDIFGVEKRLDRQSGNNFNDTSRRPLKFLRLVYEPCSKHYFTPPPDFGTATEALIKQIVRCGAKIEVVSNHVEESEQRGDSSSGTELSYPDSSTDDESESATDSEGGLGRGDDDESEDEDDWEDCSELDGFDSDSYLDGGSSDDDSSEDDDCVDLGYSDQMGRPVVALFPKRLFDDVEESYYADSESEEE